MNPVTARTESMTGQDSACLQMPASLRTSQQRCNNLHKAVVAQNQLTWQTLIHILTFLKARAKGEGTDTPIFVLYFFLLEQSSQGTFPNSAASGQRGELQVYALPKSKRVLLNHTWPQRTFGWKHSPVQKLNLKSIYIFIGCFFGFFFSPYDWWLGSDFLFPVHSWPSST